MCACVGSESGNDKVACRLILVAVLLGALILLLPRMTVGALRHWDEAWYAQVARETSEASSWLTLRWNGADWFHKPPLFFWVTARCFRLFGVSELSARAFAGACGVATVMLLAWFTARAAGHRVGLLAALLLLSIPEFCRYATRGQLDVPLTLFLVVQLFAFWHGLRAPRWHWLGGIAFGAALMTKGAAAGLGLLVQLVYLAAAREARPFRQPAWWGALIVGFALATPWHVHQWVTHGQAFLHAYGSRHFAQFFTDIYPETDDDPPAPATYYLEFLLDKQRLWGWTIPLLIVVGGLACHRSGGVIAVRRQLPGEPASLAEHCDFDSEPATPSRPLASQGPLLRFAWWWTTAIPIGLSLARTKFGWYLVPMYPGAALLAALTIASTRTWRRSPRLLIGLAGLAALFTASETLWGPANREYEQELRHLAPLLRTHVPRGTPIHTLQAGRARTCIYPTATLFYCERPVRVAHGVEQLFEIARHAGSVFHLFMHRALVETVRADGRAGHLRDGYVLEEVGSCGQVVLVRIIPGSIAQRLPAYRQLDSQEHCGGATRALDETFEQQP